MTKYEPGSFEYFQELFRNSVEYKPQKLTIEDMQRLFEATNRNGDNAADHYSEVVSRSFNSDPLPGGRVIKERAVLEAVIATHDEWLAHRHRMTKRIERDKGLVPETE